MPSERFVLLTHDGYGNTWVASHGLAIWLHDSIELGHLLIDIGLPLGIVSLEPFGRHLQVYTAGGVAAMFHATIVACLL